MPSAPRTTTRHAGFLLPSLGRRVERSWNTLLRSNEMTNADFTALAALTEGPANQRALATRMGIDPRNAGSTVRRLRDRGWITACRESHDGRVLRLELSQAGRHRWQALQDELAAARQDHLGGLTEEEIAEFERLLNKINDHMSAS